MSPSDEAPTVARSAVTSAALRAGDRWFGRFVLEALAGRGGMGVVWRARDLQLGETVALKFLPDQLAGDPRALADLRAETRRARQLAHPHIVRIHEFFSDDAGAAVAMEFVDGGSLANEIAEHGMLGPASVLAWLPDLVAALDYAHDRAKVVHRDLKPGNVLLPKSGGAKLADFGISCRISETATRCTHLLAGGTLAYMSPQQLAGEEPSPADDIYALGALLYELMTGRPPFTGGDLSYQIRERRPDPPGARRDATAEPLPATWDATILACLEKNPERRPRSAGAVLAALRGEGPPRTTRRGPSLAIAAGGIAIVTLAILGWRFLTLGPSANGRDAGAAVSSLPPLAAPQLVRGSLARGLVAHLPLAGDYENMAGNRGRAIPVGVAWAQDRFGRPGSAYVLSGRSRLELPLGSLFRLTAGVRFTLMAWVRVEEGEGAVLSLLPSGAGTSLAQIQTVGKRLTGFMFDARSLAQAMSDQTLADGRWRHVALGYDGTTMRVFCNGELVAEREHQLEGPATQDVTLVVGPVDFGTLQAQAKGAIADVRLYRGYAAGDPLSSIAAEEEAPAPAVALTEAWHFPWDEPTALTVTRGKYDVAEDWNQAVAREFGAEAHAAEWRDIVAVSGRWPKLAAELAGISRAETFRVRRNGKQMFRGDRTYQLTRLDGSVQESFLEHASAGDHAFVLGSWMEPRLLPILARVPTAGRYRVESGTVGVNGRWQRDLAGLAAENAFCLRVTFDPGAPARADGVIAVEMSRVSGAPWRIDVGPASQPRDRRLRITSPEPGLGDQIEFAMNPTPQELIVVGRHGHVFAAVVDATNHFWRGDVTVDSANFAIDQLPTLTVDGAGRRDGSDGVPVVRWVVWQ